MSNENLRLQWSGAMPVGPYNRSSASNIFTIGMIWGYLGLIILLGSLSGCLSQPDKEGNAVIFREATALQDTKRQEVNRILQIAAAKLKAHGHPDKAILTSSATDAEKDQEASQIAKEIESQAGFLSGLFGGWLGYVLSIGGSLGGIAMLAYTGRWGLAMKQLVSIFTQGVEDGKTNGELKKLMAKSTKGTAAEKLLNKYVLKAEAKAAPAPIVNPEPTIGTG